MKKKYQEQLQAIFNRPTKSPEWYHSEEVTFADDLAVFTFLETLLQNSKIDLQAFSDDQVALGLKYIFDASCSNMTHQFKAAKVSPERKVKALQSLLLLFRDVCNVRCKPKLSARSQVSISSLNDFCYMFWDITPLSSWLKTSNTAEMMQFAMSHLDIDSMDIPDSVKELMRKRMPSPDTPIKSPKELLATMQQQYETMDEVTQRYYQTIAQVMQHCLYLDNPACIESGIHGLGHLKENLPAIAYPILDEFLKNGKCKNKALRRYAQSARFGLIQ